MANIFEPIGNSGARRSPGRKGEAGAAEIFAASLIAAATAAAAYFLALAPFTNFIALQAYEPEPAAEAYYDPAADSSLVTEAPADTYYDELAAPADTYYSDPAAGPAEPNYDPAAPEAPSISEAELAAARAAAEAAVAAAQGLQYDSNLSMEVWANMPPWEQFHPLIFGFLAIFAFRSGGAWPWVFAAAALSVPALSVSSTMAAVVATQTTSLAVMAPSLIGCMFTLVSSLAATAFGAIGAQILSKA